MQTNNPGIRIKIKRYVSKIFTIWILRSLLIVWIVNRVIHRAFEELLYG